MLRVLIKLLFALAHFCCLTFASLLYSVILFLVMLHSEPFLIRLVN